MTEPLAPDATEAPEQDLARSGGKVVLQDDQGKLWDIAEEDVDTALASGFRPYSQAALDEHEKAKKWGGLGNETLAGLAGAGRGATAGLSDVALTATGLVGPETLANLKKYNPTASTAGEIGGMVAPMLLSGGTSALAQGARVAGALPRAIAGAGNLAAGATEALGLGTGILGSAAKLAAGGAVEGLLYGTGQKLSEQALAGDGVDLEAVGEAMLSGGLPGAAMGAAFGGALGGGGAALAAGVRGLGKAAGAAATPVKALFSKLDEAGVSVPMALGGAAVGGYFGGTTGALVGAAAGAGISRLRPSAYKTEAAQRAEQVITEKTESLKKVITEVEELTDPSMAQRGLDDVKAATAQRLKEQGVGDTIEQAIRLRDETPDLIKAAAREDAATFQDVVKQVDRLHGTGRQSAGGFTLKMKDETVRSMMRADEGRVMEIATPTGEKAFVPFASTEAANFVRERVFGHLASMKRSADQFAENADDYLFIPGFASKMKKMSKISAAQFKRVAAADALEDPIERIAEYYKIADQQKRAYGNVANQIPMDGNTVHETLKGGAERLRELLERDDLWGRAASDYQKKVNAIYTHELSTRSNVLKSFTRMMGTEGRKVDAYKTLESADPAALSRLYEGHIFDSVNADLDLRQWTQWLQTQKALNQTLLEAHGLTKGAMFERVQGVNQNIDKLLERVATNARKSVEYQQTVKKLEQIEQLPGVGQAVRLLARGKQFVAEDGLLGQTQAATTLQQMANFAKRTTKRIEESVEQFTKTRTETSGPIGGVASSSSKSTAEEAKEAVDAVRAAQSNPAGLVERIGQKASAVAAHAPTSVAAMSRAAMHASGYLASRLPKENLHVSPVGERNDTQRTSDRAQAQFLRRFRAVNDPMRVIEDFGRGEATREAMEALRSVYPALHSQLVKSTLNKLGKDDARLSYAQQLQLSYLLDQPVHYSMTPRFIQNTAAMYEGQAQRREQGRAIAPSKSRAPQTSGANQTLSQRTEGGASR